MNLLDLTPPDAAAALNAWVGRQGEPPYRARQILPYLWQRPAATWEEATDLPRRLQTRLAADCPIPRLEVVRRQVSNDGTIKTLWGLPDGEAIEAVWIPEGKRRTLCISSQVGCAYGCRFCATGRMGFRRHLAPWEIGAQVREATLDPECGKPTNVVFMGMGEPLHNWDAVDRALTILNHSTGLGIGARHITVSTIGLLPQLAQLAARPEQFRLAVSLHAPTSETRAALMPIERKYGLPDLLHALHRFRRRVTFEYVMIKGRNDGDRDADALANLAAPLGALINLLPLHPGGDPGLIPSDPATMTRFAAALRHRGINVTVRRSRGLDIAAACGQLRVETDQLRRVQTEPHAHIQ